MTIRLRSTKLYWEKFSVYQSFENAKELEACIKQFHKTYILTPAVKAVLNTLKLHAKKTYPGVCWLYREEIAKKAKVSLASVKRAIKELKEIGILTVHENMHTERGGRTHNVYVINPMFNTGSNPANETSSEEVSEPSETVVAQDSDDQPQTHKNLNTNSHKTLNTLNLSIGKFDILKDVPNEFIDLMEPFYANNPDLIHARWKTVLSAAKKSCNGLKHASIDTIGKAWKEVIKLYKRGKIKNSTDDGIGGYFYGVLCDYLLNDWLQTQTKLMIEETM